MEKLKVVYKKLNDIKPYEKNPRRNDEAVRFVKNSIEKFGFKNPIIVDGDGVIVAGHTRYKAAQEVGLMEVPTISADDLTPEQVKAFRLADNKTAEMAQWDLELLDEELEELELDEIDMSDFGFSVGQDDGYINDFFERGVEAKERAEVLGVKCICGTKEQVDDCMSLLKEAEFNPEEL